MSTSNLRPGNGRAPAPQPTGAGINPAVLYRWPTEAKLITGQGERSLKRLRREGGLPVLENGRLRYVLGADLIEAIRKTSKVI